MRDPLGGPGCVPVPMLASRTTWRFKLDSDRQIDRIAAASVSLNGTLVKTPAAELVARLDAHQYTDTNPREIVLELNTRRATRSIFSPTSHLQIQRDELKPETAQKVLEELQTIDDVRVTFAGTGDPLLAQNFPTILTAAQSEAPGGIGTTKRAIHIETDLLPEDPDRLTLLAESPVDIISVHIPAFTRETYKAIMGVDRLDEVVENVRTLVKLRAAFRRGIPLVVPTFTKCPQNLSEMEGWYDQWLRAIGCAVIVGPSNFAGQIPDTAIADMSPPKRRACARLSSRMMILCDGSFVQCDQDLLGKNPIGNLATESVASVWQKKMSPIRADHAGGRWSKYAMCNSCTEWHRP
jgi:spiro-SPASM protein